MFIGLEPYAPTGGLDKPQIGIAGVNLKKRHTPYAPRSGKCRTGVNLAKCRVKFPLLGSRGKSATTGVNVAIMILIVMQDM